MALPASGALSLDDIQTEFGGTNPIGIDEYYAGGAFVPPGTSGTNGPVPSSGTISINNFFGTSLPIFELYAWGNNSYAGPLGLNDLINRSSPVQVGALINWDKISVGNSHSHSVKTDNTFWSWGSNGAGEQGVNDLIKRSSPVQVGALTDWAKVAAGGNFCTAIKTDGRLFTWGNNYSGQLGLNNRSPAGTRSSPVQVGSLTDWAQTDCGGSNCAAIKTSGTLFTWGDNPGGSLGQNNINYRSSPVQVGALTNWAQVSMGSNFCAAVKTNGTALGYGD
jgi:alpha-tubulin suppressor-like RCC1 family protein